jgi:hypothetical protein
MNYGHELIFMKIIDNVLDYLTELRVNDSSSNSYMEHLLMDTRQMLTSLELDIQKNDGNK